MFLSKFRRKSTVVERVQEYTQPLGTDARITIDLPLTVDGALLATQIEHQLKRHAA